MKMPLSARVLTGLLSLFCAADVLALVTLPFLFDRLVSFFYVSYPEGMRRPLLAVLVAVGLLGLWIFGELIVMLRSMEDDPFVPRNVAALRRIGAITLLAAAVFAAKCFFDFTMLTLLCVFVLLVVSLLAATLAHLFGRAVEFKQENDLTI